MSHLQRRRFLRQAFGSVALASLSHPGLLAAQPMPQVVRLLTGLPPGTLPDLIAHTLADALEGRLARSVVVDSRPGAAARLAVEELIRTGADGNMLMITPSGVVTLVSHTFRKLSYRPFDDLMPLTMLAYSPFMLAVGPLVDASVRDMPAFARWCRENPVSASFATLAAGSPPHFVGEVLKQQFKYECTHVAWRNNPLPDMMGGHVAAAMLGPPTLMPYANGRRVRVLGTTGASRYAGMPEVRTFGEQGAEGLDWWDWYALYAHARAPRDVALRHAEIIRTVMHEPAVIERWRATTQVEPVSSTPEELDRLAREDDVRWAKIVASTGFVAE